MLVCQICRFERVKMQRPEIPEGMTRRDISRRVLRACQTVRALPDRERRFLNGPVQSSMWRQAFDIWDYPRQEELRFRPTREDIGDYMRVLGWCTKISRRDFKIVWAYSFPDASFGSIAGRYGRSDQTISTWYWSIISKIQEIAHNA